MEWERMILNMKKTLTLLVALAMIVAMFPLSAAAALSNNVSPSHPAQYGAFTAKNYYEVTDGDEGHIGINIGGGVTVNDGLVALGSYRVIASRLNYRYGPGLGFAIVGQIPMNTVITAVDVVDGWVEWVTADGLTVYSSMAYLVLL